MNLTDALCARSRKTPHFCTSIPQFWSRWPSVGSSDGRRWGEPMAAIKRPTIGGVNSRPAKRRRIWRVKTCFR
jgi:hypothetical protein